MPWSLYDRDEWIWDRAFESEVLVVTPRRGWYWYWIWHRANRIAELQVKRRKLIAETGSSNDNFSLDAKMLLFLIEPVILRLELLLRWATVLVFWDTSEETRSGQKKRTKVLSRAILMHSPPSPPEEQLLKSYVSCLIWAYWLRARGIEEAKHIRQTLLKPKFGGTVNILIKGISANWLKQGYDDSYPRYLL